MWAAGAHGCQWLADIDAARAVDFARSDHRACVEAGYRWPGEAYVDCRRFRADARQQEQWQELQMSRQQQRPEVGIRPESPIEPYRPIRAENFSCREAVAADGETYIACAEGG